MSRAEPRRSPTASHAPTTRRRSSRPGRRSPPGRSPASPSGGRPHHAPARSGKGRLRRAARQRRARSSCSPGQPRRRASRSSPSATWATGSGSPARSCGRRRGELSVKVGEWVLLAEARRNFGDKWHGVSDVETRYRQREVDLWANERSAPAAAAAQRRRAPHAPAPVGRRLRRGRDAAAASDRRRGDGAPVRHAPQHVRHRLLPARGARALSQAARRRRLRQGVRDRAQLPQRGHLAAPQSRVHDARAVPGLRRLHRHHGGLRGAGGRAGPRRAGDDARCPTAGATSTSRRRGGAPP